MPEGNPTRITRPCSWKGAPPLAERPWGQRGNGQRTLVSQLTRFVTSSQFSPAGSATLVPIRPQYNTYRNFILQIWLVPHSFPAPTCAFPRYHQQGTTQGLSGRWCIDQVASCQNGIAPTLAGGMSWDALLVWVLMGCGEWDPLDPPSSYMSIQ